MELRVEQNAPSLVVGMYHIHYLAIPKYGATFICPLEDGALEVKDICTSRLNQPCGGVG
jgi:hypothetical protein